MPAVGISNSARRTCMHVFNIYTVQRLQVHNKKLVLASNHYSIVKYVGIILSCIVR